MPPYLPHVLYSLAITSISIHYLWHKRESEEQRRHYSTRIGLLEDTVHRLRAGERVTEQDFDMIRKLAMGPGSDSAAARGVDPQREIGWREVVLGRTVQDTAASKAASQRWDEIDLEKVRKELQSSS
ncbi:hypothetical protein BDY19DRAFT_301384 [Irpex rosettiformis]|uniref:Uncharacterized protein n=1 Tax=Irpex rosettiformis TaxID=378272 RepID=A0ACB8TYG6_9APHY|nr:hypothetical protein BDY19DRAFT_301384 [Irpex rosettiformis]